MFCSNCGKQIPKDMKFCSFCGAQQSATPDADSNRPQNTPKPYTQKQKKKSNIWIVLVVALAAFLIGKFVFSPSPNPDPDPTSSYSITLSPQTTAASTSNAEYELIFSGTYIVHYKTFFNMETANFASKLDDGTIRCADYGYKDDIVKEWSESMYIPIEGYTDSQKSDLRNKMESEFASIDALDCCSVSYGESVYYFSVTLTFEDVDEPENYRKLYEADILNTNTPISMSATEDYLIAEGLIKK